MSYITFKTIGESGNLGSQIQQYSSLYALAKANNKTIVFPESSVNWGFGFKFAEILDIPIETRPDEFFEDFEDIIPNDQLIVDPSVYNIPYTNVNIINRFDLYHYWYPKYTQDVESWEWNQNHKKEALRLKESILPINKELVAIHVRRGDYLLPQHDHFCKLDSDYYSEAIAPYLEELEKYHFVIFSNDIEWCKENFIKSDMVTFIEPGSDYNDLILMSLCDHFIIANSSYSWWAAFKGYNKSKRVTCPKNYLKSYSPWSHINGNYYPENWKSIKNITI